MTSTEQVRVRPTLTVQRYLGFWAAALLAVGVVFVLCVLLGPADERGRLLDFGWPLQSILEIRLKRVIAAAAVGLALGAAGVALQALLRNALADPYVLGISSGASVGVMLWMLAGKWFTDLALAFAQSGPLACAVGGAVAASLLVYALARGTGEVDPLTLLLVGVVINAVAGAVLMFLNSLAEQGVKSDLLSYMMGAVSERTRVSELIIAGAAIVLGWLPLLLAAPALNISTLSDVEVASLGVRISHLRTLMFFCAALITAASIALAGPIGFLGLLCPHICRALFGPDHRQLTVTAPFCGAIILMLADTFVRCTGKLFGTGDLPVGVVMALLGGPFFLWLLRRRGPGGADVR